MDNCSELLKEVESQGFSDWEETIGKIVSNYGCRLTEAFFQRVDDYLARTRDKNLKMIGQKEKMLVSKHGQINVRRRYYRDSAGNYRFLLDEALGLKKRQVMTPAVASFAARLAAYVPFRVAEDFIYRAFGTTLSHQSIHNIVGKIGKDELLLEEIERSQLFEFGLIPTSRGKVADSLYLEADGVNISLQRENTRKAEVKVGVAYSGKEAGRVKDKVIHIDLDEGECFWQGLTIKVAKVFDFTKLSKTFIGGDGASFVRIGQRLFSRSVFRLDPFHVARAIKGVLGWTKESYKATKEALSGNIDAAIVVLDRKAAKADDKKSKQINDVKRYLKNNADGLGIGPSLGTIETNVDKLVANRMKKRGMAWTKAGARRMLKLLERRAIGDFDSLMTSKSIAIPPKPRKQADRILCGNTQDWLSAHIAAFDGPHQSRPWVKLLREVVRGQELQLTGFAPTKT